MTERGSAQSPISIARYAPGRAGRIQEGRSSIAGARDRNIERVEGLRFREIGEFLEGLENSRKLKLAKIARKREKKRRKKKNSKVKLSRSTKARVVHGLGEK